MEKIVKITYNKFNVTLIYNLTENNFFDGISNLDVVRYLKGIFTNKNRFESRFVNEFKGVVARMTDLHSRGKLDRYDHVDPTNFECTEKMDELLEMYDTATPFTYEEAFKLNNQQFQALVFGSINITEMIKELGHTRIKTDGIQVKHKQFDNEGNFIGYKEYDNVYEVHEVKGTKLGLDENLYAIKCWCTTTNKEHWLWIDGQHKDNPLEAIASTFRIHENLIPHIKELKRQGDILLVEMKQEVEPEGEIVSLTADQYFSLLTAQS